MASSVPLSAARTQSAMMRCAAGVLFALAPVTDACAQADASQRPVVVAAAAGGTSPSQQARIRDLQKKLKTAEQLLKQKNLTADQRKTFEARRKSLQAELDELLPKTKKPQVESKEQTAKGKK